MSITAKELATKLNLSATAVSMALNNKAGVSTETRSKVMEAAEKYGYDFSKLSMKSNKYGSIYTIWYRNSNAVISYSPIFNELMDGIERECQIQNYKVKFINFYEKRDILQRLLEDLRVSDCIGIILLGTELSEEAGKLFLSLSIPTVILDSYYDSLNCNSVLINNRHGAYLATDYLISRRMKQPGHLKSSLPLRNFTEREEGFQKAVRDNGMAASNCIVHKVAPSIDGAFADMMEILDQKISLADCYFADNDLIAIGAMKALKLRGYRLPEDISIVGFDNISESRVIDPALTTISIPRLHMAEIAVRKLVECIHTPVPYTTKIEVSTTLVKRFSV